MTDAAHITLWASLATLAYTIFGYPLLLCLLQWRRRPTPQQQDFFPTVSLIIPARNEESVLRQKLANALEIDYPKPCLQIVVASDGSTDQTTAIAEEFKPQGVQLLDCAEWRGKAATLNDAVACASGDVLCLTDANVLLQPDALRRMVDSLQDPSVGAVTGDVRLNSAESNFGQGESLYYRLERWLQTAESLAGSVMGVDGGMYVIRRELFRPLPPDTILDDFAISMACIQQGQRIVYQSAAVATENGTPSAKAEFRRRMRVSAGAVQSIKHRWWPPLQFPIEFWQYLSHKLLRWMGPIFLLLLLIASAALWNHGAIYRVVAVAQVACYFIAALAAVSLKLRATRLGGVLFYLALSQTAIALGTFKGLIFRQRGRWRRTERSTQAMASNIVHE